MAFLKHRKLIAGNWKMFGLSDAIEQVLLMAEGLRQEPVQADVLICPPATLIRSFVAATQQSLVRIGGQDCHALSEGAYTGDLSATMLADAGASAVITGHSERRAGHGETDDVVRAKTMAAMNAGLFPIVCVGETKNEREAGLAWSVVERQLRESLPEMASGRDGFAVAYEPVWAIGTGLTPTLDDIADMHSKMRSALKERFGASVFIPLLYGGSVKPSNASDILKVDCVDGALVGGASLKAADFLPIIRAVQS
jgi:triosephosphate isomerase (TIM)